MKKKKITVIGSVNMDLITTTSTRPKVGETVLGEGFTTIPGGKGANQAVAAARLGADVTFIGCVGQDVFGQELRENFANEGITFCEANLATERHTGIASITISSQDNSIIVVPGANKEVTPSNIEKFASVITESDFILLQLEIPLETVEHVIKMASQKGTPLIVNPAPYQALSKESLEKATYLTPNEHEKKQLNVTELMKDKLVVTKGSQGVSFWEQQRYITISSYQVDVVDTTGAGDAFNGALAVALSEGSSLKDACQFASAVGAITVTKLGAQSGMPNRSEVKAFLKQYEAKK
ncbi:ribokinase [Alkalihalobacillus sp. MEB130]|uniref:ribokinase n=1 Tax=Alkalihalobacillus sp. MEB130 TaxID=2976704 RepID=UPI0028DDCCA3|nr:ribokinase [Alkalihalobacillus sp. MEB130]MDT8860102.1 ribokinase [Alkalihalobacillus sp. MEB130]